MRLNALALLTVFALLTLPAYAEWKEQVLYSFQGPPDGGLPAGGVVFDKKGNLFGATQGGGSDDNGEVFELSPPAQKGGAWTETVLYSFAGTPDGKWPSGGLVIDGSGNLYGVTAYGGTGDCVLLGAKVGCGTVYEISPPQQKGDVWTETILYSFPTAKQGYVPNGNLVFDGAGNLYGATTFGGTKGTTCDAFYGGQCGVVFALSPPKTKGGEWTEKVLHNFAGGTDGANPNGGLVLDGKGAVYGTTYGGGTEGGYCGAGGCGTAFELKPPAKKGGTWAEKQLHVFDSGSDRLPSAGLTFDREGSLYGGTVGTLFRLAPPKKSGRWKETILYTFNGYAYNAEGALVLDKSGNLCGTTYAGGGQSLHGSVFRLKPPSKNGHSWTFSVIHGFLGPPDGDFPAASLVFDKSGDLYGTTQGGGTGSACQGGCGTVFEVSP
jgi:uncharacterized repeat protein (TIGR03803 family)